MESSLATIDRCKTFLIIGTSGIVQPAASLPSYAKKNNKFIIEINEDDSPLSGLADYKLRGKAGEILPELI